MKPFEKWLLFVSTFLAGGSGTAYFVVKHLMEPAQPWDVVNHPLQPWLLKLHIVTAPLLIFAVGVIAVQHIWKHFRAGVPAGRRTGLTAMVTLLPMVLTGYLIQAVTHEGWLTVLAWTHIVTGFLFLAGFVLHAVVFRGARGNGNGKGRGSGRGAGAGPGRAGRSRWGPWAPGARSGDGPPEGGGPRGRGEAAPSRPRKTAVGAVRSLLGLLLVALLVLLLPALLPAQEGGTTRTYYVAAEEVAWDYAPAGRDLTMGHPFDAADSVFVARAPGRVGSTYRKAVYREYADSTFVEPKAVPERWRHKGILGPVLRAEVGDTIRVVFLNRASRPFTLHPHGVFYDKASEGAPTNDGTSGPAKADDRVAPGGGHTYLWPVPERAGPGPSDPSSLVWLYHSHADEPADTNAGLIGVILVTRKGMADPEGRPVDVDREFVTLFKVFDENVSGYLEESLEAVGESRARVREGDEAFVEGNLMHAINGWVYGSMPLLTMREGERTRWYLVDLGSEVDLHTAHWHANTALVRGHRTGVVELMPGSMKVADLVPDNPGTWMFHCHVDDHIAAGMTARYRVLPREGVAGAR